jgi:hypothetical protein
VVAQGYLREDIIGEGLLFLDWHATCLPDISSVGTFVVEDCRASTYSKLKEAMSSSISSSSVVALVAEGGGGLASAVLVAGDADADASLTARQTSGSRLDPIRSE